MSAIPDSKARAVSLPNPIQFAALTPTFSTRSASYSDWDADRIRRWSMRVGSSCDGVVERVFESVKFDEQGFNIPADVLEQARVCVAAAVEEKSGKVA